MITTVRREIHVLVDGKEEMMENVILLKLFLFVITLLVEQYH
jgi:hypothetical protein